MERPQEFDYTDQQTGWFDVDAYEKDLNFFIDQLQKENEELKNFKNKAIEYAQKFVNKVESGRAVSRETYADMKDLLNYNTPKEGE